MNTKNDVIKIFEDTGALLHGHFRLTSGKHSDTYFQCAKVLQHPEHCERICSELSGFFKEFSIDTVIAPAIGGIVVAQELGRQLRKKSIWAEREDKSLTLRRGFVIEPGEKCLVCEDVVTTGGSVFEVIDIVKSYGGEVVGVAYIVDRSNGKVKFGVPQKSVISLDVIAYEYNNCPLCEKNIPVIKPGSRKLS
ncbi:MAG: orotate phosphoribosyltransferase [Ignavibacteriaceae bacterium]|jgi:orotate phosphoribosyltransferase|nr:orotate phosphoribosyltransferase [Ignavibacteriaceae bacterium]